MTDFRRTRAVPTAVLPCLALVVGLVSGCQGAGTADAGAGSPSVEASASAEASTPEASASGSPDADEVTEWSYPGEDGRTALELLLESDPSAEVTGEGADAYVVAIGGRRADDARQEFWALYVDGQQSQVGAGTYETKTGEEITWKLETF